MHFEYDEIDGSWVAWSEETDLTWHIDITPNGYFKAYGNGKKKLARTHFEAVQACENWDCQHADEAVEVIEL